MACVPRELTILAS